MFEDELEDEELDAGETDEVSLDDLDENDAGDVEAVSVVDTDDEDEDTGYAAAAKPKPVAQEDLPSVEAKQKDRDELARAMEEFLARGGRIQEVDASEA